MFAYSAAIIFGRRAGIRENLDFMKLFTRLAIMFLISTVLPLILLHLMMSGKMRYDTSIFLLIAAGFVLLSWVYSSILRPLDELRRATQKIKDGDLDFTLEAENVDEIGQLTQDFEEMRLRLKESQEEKLRSDRESKELISNIAHDLKTPLTAIQGYSEGILDGVASSPERMEKYIRTIYNKANDMARLIDELNFYSKIETNRIPYNFAKLRVREYFDDCAEEIGLDMEGKGITFSYQNSVDADITVIADPEQLRRVINNIVGNSVKYIDKNPGCIGIAVTDVGDFIQCDLSDNGRGVAKKDLIRIFERFYRTDASRNSSLGGSGIGLSIVKKIIEDHGGRIWASSEEGQGLVIHFQLRKYVEAKTEA